MADMVLVVTEKGYGKLVAPEEFRQQKRGGSGVTGFKVTDESGPVAVIEHVKTGLGERVIIYTAQGRALMTPVDDISVRSRTAGGVKLMNVEAGDKVVGVKM